MFKMRFIQDFGECLNATWNSTEKPAELTQK